MMLGEARQCLSYVKLTVHPRNYYLAAGSQHAFRKCSIRTPLPTELNESLTNLSSRASYAQAFRGLSTAKLFNLCDGNKSRTGSRLG